MSRPTKSTDWQTEIYRKHSGWVAGTPPHMAIGEGWAEIVARLFDRIAEALASELPSTKVAIIDIKEKYGEFRIEALAPVGPEAEAAIDRAILLAELRSECTCDECGEAGRMRSTLAQSGWLAVKCDHHAAGYPRILGKGSPRRRITNRRGTFDITYDRATDSITETLVAGRRETE
ncbi:MAG TPA: hypothetical protein VGN91_16490 [Bosea sp. (in: a-proteobacteria)]|jgi:hypothetical protein|nr:hypothetical protein [Bosea sp. (in: a-proteobacteria)]